MVEVEKCGLRIPRCSCRAYLCRPREKVGEGSPSTPQPRRTSAFVRDVGYTVAFQAWKVYSIYAIIVQILMFTVLASG
jgi:hypothetical protein